MIVSEDVFGIGNNLIILAVFFVTASKSLNKCFNFDEGCFMFGIEYEGAPASICGA